MEDECPSTGEAEPKIVPAVLVLCPGCSIKLEPKSTKEDFGDFHVFHCNHVTVQKALFTPQWKMIYTPDEVVKDKEPKLVKRK